MNPFLRIGTWDGTSLGDNSGFWHDSPMRVKIVPSFFDRATELRRHFEEKVGPSRESTENRFVWDYWHIPGQFTYFRTPALNVIPPSLVAGFTEALRRWGHENLGSVRVTVPWLSYYIEGCRQELHSDVVQGTWSYVYSLTPWDQRRFTGGETLIAGEHLLDYWPRFDPASSSEQKQLIDRVPAHFNQLCVFDSRLPHGVNVVEGTRAPLLARVALHGWFREPQPSLEGSLTLPAAEPVFEALRTRWRQRNEEVGPFHGKAVWRFSVDEQGHTSNVKLVVDNLVAAHRRATDSSVLLAFGEASIQESVLPASAGRTTVSLPLGEDM